jgi:hypothetical protein
MAWINKRPKVLSSDICRSGCCVMGYGPSRHRIPGASVAGTRNPMVGVEVVTVGVSGRITGATSSKYSQVMRCSPQQRRP